jgi:hypothetical protein
MRHKIYWTKSWKRVPRTALGIVSTGARPAMGRAGRRTRWHTPRGVGLGWCEVAGSPLHAREKSLEQAPPRGRTHGSPCPRSVRARAGHLEEGRRGRRAHGGPVVRGCPVWSKNSCSLTLVVFQEASEPFTTLNGALTLAALAGGRKEEDVVLPLMIALVNILPGMNAGASTYTVPSPIEGSGTAWVLLGSWALSPARPTPIHPRHECRGFSAFFGELCL